MTIQAFFLLIVSLILNPIVAKAEDLEQLLNEKSSSPAVQATPTAHPYSLEELIKIIPNHLDDQIHYGAGHECPENAGCLTLDNDALMEFNKETFGDCREFYIYLSSNDLPRNTHLYASLYGINKGRYIFSTALQSLFGDTEAEKQTAKVELKTLLTNEEFLSTCTKFNRWQIKVFLSDIFKAAPLIAQEKQQQVNEKQAKLAQEKRRATEAHQRIMDEENAQAAKAAKQQAEKEQRIKESIERHERCVATDTYKLHTITQQIVFTQQMKKAAEARIQKEDEVAKISGVVNKEVKYEAGKWVVEAKTLLPQLFAKYKALGGTATSLDNVVEVPDPCL